MACIVAVLGAAGAPLDRSALLHLADVSPFCRDRAEAAIQGPAGVCAVPLPHQSGVFASLPGAGTDSGIHVVFDGRIDDRPHLAGTLGVRLPHDASDAELILQAYQKWDADLVEHLLGDFAFCLWDARRGRLLCARDHFGVKPLYYAHVGGGIVVSNVLQSVQRCRGVSARLSDAAVGDFLLFGELRNPRDTFFADVSRLPAAHVLSCRLAGAPIVTRYWSMAEPPLLQYGRPAEYVEHFGATLRQAVADRTRGKPVGILMSGGLDSSSLAAMALDLLGGGAAAPAAVRAFTAVYDVLMADDERRYSSIAADALGMPIEHMSVDRYRLFDRWDGDARPPEPVAEPFTAMTIDLLRRAGQHAPVALTGDGGDPFLLPATVQRYVGRMPWGALLSGVWQSMWRYRELPLLGLRSGLRRLTDAPPKAPAWLAPDLLAVYDAAASWQAATAPPVQADGVRVDSLSDVHATWWPATFETMDPGYTGQPIELRYPFFDVRVVSLALRLPSYPWCVNKTILRETMKGRLPDAIRLRPKAALAGDPVGVRPRWSMADVQRTLRASPEMDRFVDRARFEAAVQPDGLLTDAEPGTLAAVSLAMWLAGSAPSRPGGQGATRG